MTTKKTTRKRSAPSIKRTGPLLKKPSAAKKRATKKTPLKGVTKAKKTAKKSPSKKKTAKKAATKKTAKKSLVKRKTTKKTTKKVATKKRSTKKTPAKRRKSVDSSGNEKGLELIPQTGHLISDGENEAAVMAVSFPDAMKITPLLESVGRQEQFKLSRHLADHSGDLLSKALTDSRIVMEKGEVVVRFSAKGTKLLKAKTLRYMADKSGRKIPTLVNSSGRTAENARVVGAATKGTRVAANLTVAVVTVAHIISGADISKKINKLDSKVEFLVATHRISQVSRIEGVFFQARELVNMGLNDTTRLELHRLGRELFEVRSAWRREISYHLGNLTKSEESNKWIVRRFQGLSRKGKDKKRADAVAERDGEIQLINGCIAIHIALAQAAGTLETFLSVSLPSEIEELRLVREQLSSKQEDILEKHADFRQAIDDTCVQMTQMIEVYEGMIIPRMPIEESHRRITSERQR